MFANADPSSVFRRAAAQSAEGGSSADSDFVANRPVISNGEDPGAAMGLVSGLVTGPDRSLLGSHKVMQGATPSTRLTSLTGQNAMPNSAGITLNPAQHRVQLLD